MDQPKLERMLRLMKYLSGNVNYTVGELGRKLEMSPRTVYRYLDTFKSAGFSVTKLYGDVYKLASMPREAIEIDKLIYFSEEEAYLVNSLIDQLVPTNSLKANLKQKLSAIYRSTSIADYVADRRASTPSNAAEIAVPDCREIAELLAGYELRAFQGMRKELAAMRERVDACAARRVMTDPMVTIDDRRMELDHSRERLIMAEEQILSRKKQRFVASTAALEAMSPLRVLTRGYAIADDRNGKSIRSVSELRCGDRITLRLSDGSADCTVEDVKRSTI